MRPAWRRAVLGLAAFQVADAVACAIPIAPIAAALDAVACPQPVRRVLPVIKAVSAAGLVGGLRDRRVGRATSLGLHAYFMAAVGFHVRARDRVQNTLPAAGLAAVFAAVAIRGFGPDA